MLPFIYFFLGASLGSFIGLVCDRFPEKSIISPGSHCSHCQHKLSPLELIPILSQLCLGFRCLVCKNKVPMRYCFIEIFCGTLLVLHLYGAITLSQVAFLLFSLCLAIYDVKTQSFPLVIWLVMTPFFLLLMKQPLVIFFLFLTLAVLSFLKNLPLGEGDLLYLATSSLIFPFNHSLMAIEIACLLGLAYYGLQKDKTITIPFIPFLALGFLMICLIF